MPTNSRFPSRACILFQGDSITDAGRVSSPDEMGFGYVSQIHESLQSRYPEEGFRILNRGVGGDRSVELLARWKADCLDLKPQVLSISVGINDVWRLRGEWNGQSFVTAQDFEANYRQLITQALEAGVTRLVLMSPTTIDEERDRALAQHLDERMEIVHSLATEFGAVYVPTREAFKHALESTPHTKWTDDGCHPTWAGHALIAQTWLQAVGL